MLHHVHQQFSDGIEDQHGAVSGQIHEAALAGIDTRLIPSLDGYVVGAVRPSAVSLLESPLNDPILASWRVGLGKVTAWTSDGGDRWAAGWAGWDGFGDFWSTLVRDTFPLGGSEGQRVEARIADEAMSITPPRATER